MRIVRGIAVFLGILFLCLVSATLAYRDSGEIVNYAGFKYVTAIATSIQRTYVATTQGIVVFNKTENRWETPLAGVDGIDAGMIKKIWVDQFDERLFAQTEIGLYEYDLTFGRWVTAFEVASMPTNDRHLTPPEVLFPPFGYDYDGYGGLIDPQARKYEISDIVDDGAGTLWIGTWGAGLFRAGSSTKVMEPLPYGLLQDAAYLLQEFDSVLYITGPAHTSRRTGITAFDLRNNNFSYIESGQEFDLPAEDIQCMDINGNRLIIGTNRGLVDLSRKSGRVNGRIDYRLKIRTEDFTAVRAVGDSIFMGTTEGLMLLSSRSDSLGLTTFAALSGQMIYDLEVVRDQLWIGSDNGAFRLSLMTGKLQKFQDPDRLLFNRVYDIASTADALWLSSDAGALRIDLDSGSTTPFRLTMQRIGTRAIAANDQIAAIASDRGLTLIFPEKDRWNSRELSTQDGLLSPYVFALRFDGDYLWAGTDKGLSRIAWSSPRLRN